MINFVLVYMNQLQKQNTIEIKNCFNKQSKLTLNKIQRSLTINLVSTYNSNCNIFTGDVRFTLVPKSDTFSQSLQILVQDFQYSTSNQVFLSVPDDVDVTQLFDDTFAMLKMSTMHQTTMIEIVVYDELRLDISKCFQELRLQIDNPRVTFRMCPYNCVDFLMTKDTNPNQYISKIELVIDRFLFSLNVQDFVNNYNEYYCYIQEIEVYSQDMEVILGVSFPVSKIFIYMSKMNVNYGKQHRNYVGIAYPVDIVIKSISDVFRNQEVFLYFDNDDYGFEVLFDYNLDIFGPIGQMIETMLYTHVEYKLTCANLNYDTNILTQQQISQSQLQFNASHRAIKFSCKNIIGAQKSICENMFNVQMNAIYGSEEYNFDIMFYFDTKLVFMMKARKCTVSYSCWNYGIALLTNSGVQIQLSVLKDCYDYEKFYDYSNISTYLIIKKNFKPVQTIIRHVLKFIFRAF
ncbi:Conserved_hypothetical protein [Hexamita inflata]|uniref:Uncharacterized protein n=1 Tax=Hexamita inflata TaxID=28002 RepID=A0ABP1H3T9_9EUKA